MCNSNATAYITVTTATTNKCTTTLQWRTHCDEMAKKIISFRFYEKKKSLVQFFWQDVHQKNYCLLTPKTKLFCPGWFTHCHPYFVTDKVIERWLSFDIEGYLLGGTLAILIQNHRSKLQ